MAKNSSFIILFALNSGFELISSKDGIGHLPNNVSPYDGFSSA